MPLTPGDRVGPYQIVASIGAGGMGEVYRAHDATLGRDIAIKVLPLEFSEDTGRLKRFEREARVLAALNHPNVGAIYGVEMVGATRALILELVEGHTLADRIGRGPMPVSETLRIVGQIANAVQAAHLRGIVHRDLKPANIKVTPDGTVKVLDFGLAKIAEPMERGSSEAATITVDGTRAGVIVGTAGYMSPEQARGDVVDGRTDIWALGCIVYEMLTALRPFDGRTASDTIAKVLEREPDWSALPRSTPASVRALLNRCLAKEPGQRLQEMSGVQAFLDLASSGKEPTTRNRTVAAATAVVLISAGLLGVYQWLRPDHSNPSDASRWQQLTNFPDAATQPTLSADGRMLAFIRGDGTFATEGQVYLKHLPDGDAVALTHDATVKMDPVFSPDGNRLVYTVTGDPSAMDSGWDTWDVPIVRGEPRRWLLNASALTWVAPAQLLFSQIKNSSSSSMGIVRSGEDRVSSRELYFPERVNWMAHRSRMSPNGQWVLIAEMDERSIFTSCRLIATSGGSTGNVVGPAGRCTEVAWSPDGAWMYFTVDMGEGAHLWRQRFPNGAPEQLTKGTTTLEEGLAIESGGRWLISSVGQQRRGIWLHAPTGDRQISPEGYAYWPLLSTDRTKIYFRVSHGIGGGYTPSELWMTDLASGRFERLFPGRMVTQYDLSADGRIVAAVIEDDGKPRLWVTSLDGHDPPQRLGSFESAGCRFGKTDDIFFVRVDGTAQHLFRTTASGATPEQVSSEPIGGVLGTVSPDGLWITDYRLNEMRAISTKGEASVPILHNFTARVRWSPDGTRALLAIQTGPGPSAFGFGRTYVLPLEPGSTLPRTPPGGFHSEAELAAVPGVEVIPYGDLSFSTMPGVYAFSKITVTRNLYRIPLE